MRKKTVLATVILLLATMAGQSQVTAEYSLKELPTHTQLPVANIHAIMQDKEGFMWYATKEGGLCRDNGYHIDVFRSDRFHPGRIGDSNNITTLDETKEGNIIFGSHDGLFLLDKRDYSIRRVASELRGLTVEPLLVADDGSIWLSADRTIYHYDSNLKLIDSFPSTWKGGRAYACRMGELADGLVWISQWKGGVLFQDKKSGQMREMPWDDSYIPISIVEDSQNGCFWVATWGNGIVKYVPNERKIESQPCTMADGEYAAQVIHMLIDRQKRRLFVSTQNGLRAYDIVQGHLQTVDLTGILPKKMGITDMMTFDNRGNLWVSGFSPHTFILSSSAHGVERKDFSDVPLLNKERLIIWNTVREDDYLWIGQERVMLCLYNMKTGEAVSAKDSGIKDFASLNMMRFCRNKSDKGIWCYVDNNVYHAWNTGMSVKAELVATTESPISYLLDDGDGNLYIGHLSGIDIYRTADKSHRRLPVSKQKVTALALSSTGKLYYCSDHYMATLDEKGKEHVISDDGYFTSIDIDRRGTVWVADNQGNLLSYNPATGKLIHDNKGSNSKGDNIKALTTDHLGHIWILTDQEIKEYNPANGNFRIITTDDQDIKMDYFTNIACEDSLVKVSGAGAILRIKPLENLDVSHSSARPLVTSVTIDGESFFIGNGMREISIGADAVNIELQFSTLNHLNTDKVTYAYRIEGIDNAWHYLPQGENKAAFVKLPKGNYTVELMATDESGSWGKPVQALVLRRLPAWYESWWAYLIYALLAAALVYLGVRAYLGRQRQRQQQEMEERLTEMKFRFFTNVSHELRTPLTLILTPLGSLRRRLHEVSTETIGTQLALIDNNAQRLLGLVNRLLDFRKLEMGQQKLELSNGDFYEFVNSVCETFRPLSREKSIGLGCAIPNKSLYMNFDRNKVQLIISNLLSNAFKFTPEGGNIAVSVRQTDSGQVCLTVSDTGCGIKPQDLPHVFERFFQSRSASESATAGTGIGLNMVQELAKLHGGTVSVDSIVGKGTTFTVTLPTDLTVPSVTMKGQQSDNQQSLSDEETGQMNPNLLIVDDNDEFRQFLCDELSGQYNTLQAADGEDALKMVQEHDIDMIISDVMMPRMDGMELCRRIKEDVSTSHIMMILLTARTAEEVKIEGYRSGADDYLSKPFNMEMLLLRIRHLLELRKRRIQAIGSELKSPDSQQSETEAGMEETSISELDKKFLADAVAAVEKNLSNEEYDIDSFASDVFMSRSTLYRKLVSLVGQKPSEFIRTIRLKHAARLIKEGKYSLTEVGYICGFSSTSYFYRCFKKQYGVQPGNYQ